MTTIKQVSQLAAKQVSLTKIQANPYRNLANYPIDENKVNALIESFESTGVWPNIVARSTGNGSVEIAYGHHRLVAARKHLGKNGKITVQVGKLSNEDMLRIMARENLEEWRSNAAVEHETLRATIDAYGRDEIGLSRPNKKTNKSLIYHARTDESEHPFTLRSIAEFLGWTKKDPTQPGGWRPNSAAEQAWKALRMMDEGVLKASDFTGLSRDQADRVATHAARKKREYDQAAKEQEKMANIADKKNDKARAKKFSDNAKNYRKEGKEVAKDVAKIVKKELLSGAGVREATKIADDAVSSPDTKVKETPDVNEFALKLSVEILRGRFDEKKARQLDEVIKHCEHLSDSRVKGLCSSLEDLSKRLRKFVARIERARHAKRKVDNRSMTTSGGRRLISEPSP